SRRPLASSPGILWPKLSSIISPYSCVPRIGSKSVEALAGQRKPADPLEFLAELRIVERGAGRVSLHRGDDLPRRVELSRKHAFGGGRHLTAFARQHVANTCQLRGRAAPVMPQPGDWIEAVQRQQLPPLAGDQVHRVDDVVEHRL